jgi:type IV pilus assembly protein PilN
MQIEINLASQPHGEMQRFLLRWGVAVGGVAVLTLLLAVLALQAFLSWRTVERQAARLQQQIAARDQENAQVEGFLSRAENLQTRRRSEFLNGLLARKAFSWTEVFTDLERIMPARLRVLSLHPGVDHEGELELKLVVTGPAREAAIELVRRLETSPHFTQARIESETMQRAQGGQGGADVVQYDITAVYIPKFARPPETEEPAAATAPPAEDQRQDSAAPGKTPAGRPARPMEARNAHH